MKEHLRQDQTPRQVIRQLREVKGQLLETRGRDLA